MTMLQPAVPTSPLQRGHGGLASYRTNETLAAFPTRTLESGERSDIVSQRFRRERQ
jgi:hypothetical protein